MKEQRHTEFKILVTERKGYDRGMSSAKVRELCNDLDALQDKYSMLDVSIELM